MGGTADKPEDDFWATKKEQFLQRMVAKGYDLYECQDWIATNGYPFFDDSILTQNHMSKGYKNSLFVPESQEEANAKRQVEAAAA